MITKPIVGEGTSHSNIGAGMSGQPLSTASATKITKTQLCNCIVMDLTCWL